MAAADADEAADEELLEENEDSGDVDDEDNGNVYDEDEEEGGELLRIGSKEEWELAKRALTRQIKRPGLQPWSEMLSPFTLKAHI